MITSVRILYLNPCGQLGGAEISLLDVLASIRTAEPDWELWLVLGEDGPLVDRAIALGVQVMVEPFPQTLARLGDSGSRVAATLWSAVKGMIGIVSYFRRLSRGLAAIQPELVHTNGFKMHILGLWARPSGTPVVWHIRDYVSSRSLMRRLMRIHGGRCAAIVGNSKSVVRDIQSICGKRPEAICIYNAVDLAHYSPEGDRADLASLAGISPAQPGIMRIGLVATLAHWKGHAVFLKALARLPGDILYRAYVIGGPIYQTDNSQYTLDELRALAHKLGIGDKVGFTGFVPDPAPALRALDIVVHASTQPEPFGRVIAEAMATGRPIVCSASGGAAELINEGYDAMGHPPGDVDVLAQKITQLARNSELRARMGRAGRLTAERRFAPERLAAELVPLYRRLCGHAASSASTQVAAAR